MSKTPSDRLFQLIKSLSGSEKRYFKLFVNDDGDRDNKYIQLFDAIDRQEHFDDEQLRKIIYNGRDIQSRKYSELKAYLYDLVIKSLQAYDQKTSIAYRLGQTLKGVRSLYKRSLYEDCHKLLQKAAKWAETYEQYDALLEIMLWQKQIAYARGDIGVLDKQLAAWAEKEVEYLEKMRNETDYHNLFYRVFLTVRKNALRAGSQDKELQKVAAHPLLASADRALTHRAKVLYYRTLTILSFSAKNYDAFYEQGAALINLIESNPVFLEEDVSEYISALSNFAVSCGYLGRFDEVNSCLDKMQHINPITLDDRLKIHRQYYTHKFRLCIETGNFEEGLKVVKSHLNELEHLDKELFERSSFYFQYFYIFFGAGNYNRALDYLNEWLNLPRSIERQDLQSLARVLNLLIHYEMGNTLLLDSLLRSTYRFLNKKEGLLEFEVKIIQFIRQANKTAGRKALEQALRQLKEDFHALMNIPRERSLLQLFDFEAWIDSRLQRRSFAEILKEKFKKSQIKT